MLRFPIEILHKVVFIFSRQEDKITQKTSREWLY